MTAAATVNDGGASPVQVADSGHFATDARAGEMAQGPEGDEEPALGLPAARVIAQRAVDDGQISQAQADEMLAGIARGDAAQTKRFNALTRGVARIPSDWTADETDSEGGVYYRNPDNPKYDYVRIMPGNPQSSNPAQQNPYVIDQKSGRFLTTDGKRMEGNDDKATHIPLADYRFDKR
jgi:hypothetical protein